MASQPNDGAQQDVLYQITDQVAWLTINRPDVQNTISGPMLDALTQHLISANENPDVRAIVITGAGSLQVLAGAGGMKLSARS